MKTLRTTRRGLPPRGFSLIEVTLAIGVAAFCLVAIFGLLPVGINSNQMTVSQTAAAGIAASVVADLRAAPIVSDTASAPSNSPLYGIPVPRNTNDAKLTHVIFVRDDGTEAINPSDLPSSDVDTNAVTQYSPGYRVSLTFAPPAANTATTVNRAAITVRVLVTWPATADPKAASTPTNFSGSFEAVTALDRR